LLGVDVQRAGGRRQIITDRIQRLPVCLSVCNGFSITSVGRVLRLLVVLLQRQINQCCPARARAAADAAAAELAHVARAR